MKLVIGLPWYVGPDDNTFPLYFDQMMYYGALRERTIMRDVLGHSKFMELQESLPSLDESPENDGSGEPTEEEWEKLGRLEIMLCNYSRTSLVGKAREIIVDNAKEWGADYLFWWDADMQFKHSAFLNLWRNQKPVVGALAFTARHPIHPVMYRIRQGWDSGNNATVIEGSDVVFDYPKDRLVGNNEVGGELAIGGGVVLYDMAVFNEIPKPWFSSTGCGEDWFFCYRCSEYNVDRYVDTRVKTLHKEHAPRWADEESYWHNIGHNIDEYKKIYGADLQVTGNGLVSEAIVGAV